MTNTNEQEHLTQLIADFDTAMLVTHDEAGRLRARPLTVAGTEDGYVYFATSQSSPKVDEIADDSRVAVTFQSERKYVSVSGTARAARDKELIARLWKEPWKVWFPKGKDDPSITILTVTPETAEYWDLTGLTGVRYALRSLKAYLTGTKAPDRVDPEQNAKVSPQAGHR